MKIALASDHAGFLLKGKIKSFLRKKGHVITDTGCFSEERCDYPDFAKKAARLVANKKTQRAVLVCGSGLGMSMAANKIKGIRAAACESLYTAKMSRAHNDSNVLCLGSRILDFTKAKKIISAWLDTSFEGGRHAGRVRKIG